MIYSENKNGNVWKRKSTKIVASIGFIATIIGIIPTVSYYYKSWKTKDIHGKWKITCYIKSSSYRSYIGKSSGFKIYFTQEEGKICGKGEMCWVDDKEIPYEQHVPITIEGKADGEKIILSYVQNGARRTTVGEFNLEVDSENILKGTFSGTAADSKGTVIAERID